jgi:ABC-type glycerol-3-phosphate transport system substrate-binding protein
MRKRGLNFLKKSLMGLALAGLALGVAACGGGEKKAATTTNNDVTPKS